MFVAALSLATAPLVAADVVGSTSVARRLLVGEPVIRARPRVLSFDGLTPNLGCNASSVALCESSVLQLSDVPLTRVESVTVDVTQGADGPRFTRAQVQDLFNVFAINQVRADTRAAFLELGAQCSSSPMLRRTAARARRPWRKRGLKRAALSCTKACV